MAESHRRWQAILDQAGTNRISVDHATWLEVELNLYTETISKHYPPPAWLGLPVGRSRAELEGCHVVRREEGLFWVSAEGAETWLPRDRADYQRHPSETRGQRYAHLWEEGHSAEALAELERQADAAAAEPGDEEVRALLASGRYDVARKLTERYAGEVPFYFYAGSPYNSLLGLLGFQGMMAILIEEPEKAHRILRAQVPRPSARLAAARALGVGIVFVEECLASADLISPAMYREFVFPYTKQTLDFYEGRGFRTVLYFSGNLMPLLEDLRELPFTALAFEEDRKNYGIDLSEVRRAMGPERVLYGNVDAPFIERATEAELLTEVSRQVQTAGPDRFVLSPGSPFTPDTALERVRLFCESTRRI